MALDFPSSPSPGDVFDSWEWDGTKWIPAPGSGGPLTGPIIGVTDGSNAAAGDVGEFITQSDFTSLTPLGASNSWTSIGMSLTAGDWDVSAAVQGNGSNALPTMTEFNWLAVFIDTTAGAPSPSPVTVPNRYNIAQNLGGALTCAVLSPIVRFSLSATTTIYMNVQPGYVTGNAPAMSYFFRARRMR